MSNDHIAENDLCTFHIIEMPDASFAIEARLKKPWGRFPFSYINFMQAQTVIERMNDGSFDLQTYRVNFSADLNPVAVRDLDQPDHKPKV